MNNIEKNAMGLLDIKDKLVDKIKTTKDGADYSEDIKSLDDRLKVIEKDIKDFKAYLGIET